MGVLTPYPLTPIGNFLGVVLALLPLLSQARRLSLAVWGYAIWIAIYDFTMFVNTIIWHNNVNIVAPVWCDITTRLQIGTTVGARTCVFAICVHLYKVTRVRSPIATAIAWRRKAVIYEILLVLVIPFLIMALFIIVQPFRFQILEEAGCGPVSYSWVGYIIYYGVSGLASIGCLVLAPLTLGTFIRHRKEMNEYLSNSPDVTYKKYSRLMVIACLDILCNLPVLIVVIVTQILQGPDSSLNYPYISWKNVHDGAGGNAPGLSLSSILQTPADEWGTNAWGVFTTKWTEWLYVFHAIIFFCVFGTTKEMRGMYCSAFWFVPERFCGLRKKRVSSDSETISDAAFTSGSQRLTENFRSLSSSESHSSMFDIERAESTASTGSTRFDSTEKSKELEN